jgi:hypothetical protein
VLIFIDTPGEPDGSDGGPALRVLVNDGEVYEGVTYAHDTEHQGEAHEQTWRVIVPAYADEHPDTDDAAPVARATDDSAYDEAEQQWIEASSHPSYSRNA